MIEYSHENSLVFGYNGGVLNERSSADDVLSYTFKRCERDPLPFKQELQLTAKLLYEKAQRLGRPIYLLQSGGQDSEVMIKSFKAAGVPFQTITFRFPNGQNQHELLFVNQFSEREGLNTQFYELDFLKWLKTSEGHEWFHLANSTGTSMLPHMKLLHHIWFELGGMPVIGGGDIVIIKQADKSWGYSKYEHMLPWFWFCAKQGIDCGVAFFQHTPETTLAALREPLIQHAATGQNKLANAVLDDLRQIKYKMYRQNWPDITPRLKYGGSELIYRAIVPVDTAWKAERPYVHDKIWTVPYEKVVADLEPLVR